jgi:hypothetical protein
MSRFNSVPVIVQQMVEDIQSPSTPSNVRFNKVVVLETIRDYCDKALREYAKTESKKGLKTLQR